jgi:P4 family phage/plasmid primase-like protien
LAHDGQSFGTKVKGTIKISKAKIDSVVHIMTILAAHPDFFADAPAGVNCQSGFIRFNSDGQPVLEPHHRDHRCRHTLSANYTGVKPLAATSLMRKLLGGMFRDDPDAREKEALLQELAGSAIAGLATKLKQPKAVVILGRGANNGKSTFLDLLRGLMPASAVATISPVHFEEPRYRVKLAGRLLNTSDELSAAAIASDLFKTIITGDPIAAHDVYKSGVEFRPVAQHVFATNRLPAFIGGLDKGVRRRLLVLELERSIPKYEMIPDLGERILADEMDALLAWAIDGAIRLLDQREFTTPASSHAALEKWTRDTDPVRAWLALRIVLGLDLKNPDGYSRPQLYKWFCEWADQNGYRKDRLPAINEFIDRIADDYPCVRERTKTSRTYTRDHRVRGRS